MSNSDGNSLKQNPVFFVNKNLVSHALAEFHENKNKVLDERLLRAESLLKRISPDFAQVAEIYVGNDRIIYCDVHGIEEGFGMLSLRFCHERLEEDDYFQVENYMEMCSAVRIYSLYDLGEALYAITESAQFALQSLRKFSISKSETGCDLN